MTPSLDSGMNAPMVAYTTRYPHPDQTTIAYHQNTGSRVWVTNLTGRMLDDARVREILNADAGALAAQDGAHLVIIPPSPTASPQATGSVRADESEEQGSSASSRSWSSGY